MGGNTWLGGIPAIETEPIENLELLHLEAAVEPDGSAVTLAFHTAEGQIDLAVPIDRMPAAVAEIREAGALMMRRQLKACRKNGQSVIQDLMRRAARPATIMPTIDRATGDCVIVYRFEDQMPFVVRVSMEMLVEVRATFDVELMKLSH